MTTTSSLTDACTVCGSCGHRHRTIEAAASCAYRHSCGGWYAAAVRLDGSHRQPDQCVVAGYGRCYDTARAALAVRRGELDGRRPDGGDGSLEDE